jgi:dTDP-4-dehydrorhamnose reductase
MILVFGKDGQVGRELSKLNDVKAVGRQEADLSDPAACAALIRFVAPRAVINAAAYTNVDKAQSEQALATVINADAPAAMGAVCAELGIPMVHISTDYVYSGAGSAPQKTTDPTGPLNVYGTSKLAGEEGVRLATHVILRTSWVFSEHGNNFVKSMLRLGAERDSLNIVADQIGGPTAASDLAQACYQAVEQLIADPSLSGTFNYAGAPDVSWADFAREIFAKSGVECVVNDIPSHEFPTPAARPKNSRMDCSALSKLSIQRPDWRDSLTNVLSTLGYSS